MTCDRVRVGDVLALQRRAVTIDPMADYRLIGVYSFGKGIFHREPIVGSELGDYRFFAVEPGDLVLSNIQAWEGAIGYATTADSGTVGTHRFLTYVPTSGRIDANWARWFFLSEPGMRLIRRAAPGTTMRNRTLSIERFEALEIALPSFDEQLRTVEYLESIHASSRSVSANLARNERGRVMATLPSFVDVLTTAAAAGSSRVAELADFVSDTVHPGEDPSPAGVFVGLQHIESHTGRRTGSEALGALKGRKFRFRPGDVIYGYLRPYLNKVWVADRHGLCSVDQYVLRPRPGVSPTLLGHLLRGRNVLDSAIELTHSLQLPRLRSGLLASLEVANIAGCEADELAERLDLLRDRVVVLAAKRQGQVEVANALVPAALNEAFGRRSLAAA